MAVTFTLVSQGTETQQKVTSVACAAADTVTVDMLQQGNYLQITMPAGNITFANPLNPAAGMEMTLWIKQDGTGSRTITWGNAFKKNITLTTTASAVDQVTFLYDGTNWNQKSSTLNIA